MKILLWTKHPGDLIGEAIEFFTHGPVEHAAFLRANGMIHEAYWPRVRDRKPVAEELHLVKCFSLRGITADEESGFEAAFDFALIHTVKYDLTDLLRVLFNKPDTDEKHTFCSRYVMHTIMTVCPPEIWPLVRCMDGDWVSPRDLFISPNLLPAEPLKLIA